MKARDSIKGDDIKQVPKITDPLVRRAAVLNVVFNFLAAPLGDNLAPFLGVYLVFVLHRTPGETGIILAFRNYAMLACKLPAGWLIDATPHKKMLFCFVCAIVTAAGVSVIFCQNDYFLIGKTIVEGAAQAMIDPLRGAFTLGMVGKIHFDSWQQKSDGGAHSGTVFSAIAAGCIAYFLYPNVVYLFWIIGVMGVAAIICLLAIPLHRTPGPDGIKKPMIDHNASRNECEEENKNQEKKEAKQKCTIFKALCRRSNIPFFHFTFSVFIYHFANAAVLPLLSQYVALQSVTNTNSSIAPINNSYPVTEQTSGGRNGIPYASAVIAIAQIASTLTCMIYGKLLQLNMGYKLPMLVGFGALPIRCALIVLLIKFWPNAYALILTQILDGVGDGVYKLSLVIVTRALTLEMGNFGLAIGMVQVAENIGASFSNIVAGYFVTEYTYDVGFLFLGAVACVAFSLFCCLRVPKRAGDLADRVDYVNLKDPLLENDSVGGSK